MYNLYKIILYSFLVLCLFYNSAFLTVGEPYIVGVEVREVFTFKITSLDYIDDDGILYHEYGSVGSITKQGDKATIEVIRIPDEENPTSVIVKEKFGDNEPSEEVYDWYLDRSDYILNNGWNFPDDFIVTNDWDFWISEIDKSFEVKDQSMIQCEKLEYEDNNNEFMVSSKCDEWFTEYVQIVTVYDKSTGVLISSDIHIDLGEPSYLEFRYEFITNNGNKPALLFIEPVLIYTSLGFLVIIYRIYQSIRRSRSSNKSIV